jgi:yeast amino acid transporter
LINIRLLTEYSVEFILGIIKIAACIGFILFAVVDDCGGVKTDPRGYIGAHYWHDPGAFKNGFKGFCSVFVNAAFAFGGTELAGLAAAEAADPAKTLPKATRQVFWRIFFFYGMFSAL